ncbi:MAG: radical SAM protein, partial [Actinomycetota bacterium]
LEALRRGRDYLEALGAGVASVAQGRVVAVSFGAGMDGASAEACSPSWSAGLLAGAVDAQAAGPGPLGLASEDPLLLDWASRALDRLNLPYERDPDGRQLMLGSGVRERLALVQATDPAVSRIRVLEREPVPSGPELEVVAVEPLGRELAMFDITTGTGNFIAEGVVSHNCFARPTHSYLDFNAGKDFESRIVVKVNAPDLLRRELRRASWKGDLIAMGTNTDPYQRAEGHYRLMRGILTELNAARNPYSILTKGTLIQRDLDLLTEGAAVTEVAANVSVGTVDEEVWRKAEPGTPHPLKRLEMVRMLNDAGIPTGVLMAPILPGISDAPEQLAATVAAAAAAGATHITPITLHLRPGVKEEFWPWLEANYPDLVPLYQTNYRRSYAKKDVSERIGAQVGELRRHHGVTKTRPSGGRGPQSKDDPAPEPAAVPVSVEGGAGSTDQDEQLSLDLGADGPRRVPRGLRPRR